MRSDNMPREAKKAESELSALRAKIEAAPIAYVGVCSLNSAPQFSITSSDPSWRGKRVRPVVCDE